MSTNTKYAIGIDLGGTSIKYALIDESGTFLYHGKVPSYADVSSEAVIEQLTTAIGHVRTFAMTHEYPIQGIGLGTPGITDKTNRIVVGGAENIKGWENISLADILENETELPTRLGNDANLMGLGETIYGAGRGCSHVVFLTVGTGIGGAVIIDGQLFSGYANRGTELGHTPLLADGERCSCGSIGCLEAYASTSALVRQFTRACAEAGVSHAQKLIDGEFIVMQYKQGNPIAIECLNQHWKYLGRGIAGFINIFSPQRVVIGGGVSEAGDFYIEQVSQNAFKHTISACAENTRIVKACLGNKAGCLGAASLILNN